jgi:predicted nucleic acid-binding protein
MPAIYWDASAVLSALTADAHSRRVATHLRREAAHLLSTLALAESLSVLCCMAAAGELPAAGAQRAAEGLVAIPWTTLELQPDRGRIAELATHHRLRGGDLWHLALALTTRAELPELRLLTFDRRLASAAEAEGLALAD